MCSSATSYSKGGIRSADGCGCHQEEGFRVRSGWCNPSHSCEKKRPMQTLKGEAELNDVPLWIKRTNRVNLLLH